MKKLVLAMIVGLAFPLCTNAQLAKSMSKYHEKNGVTVTQLDKSLYGLYQRNNLPADATEVLQKLDEVNILNVNLSSCEPELASKIVTQFKNLLDNTEKYKLIKSRNDDFEKQLIYTQTKNGKVSDLVVWNQNARQIDIIELRGDIQLDKIALLSRALNIKDLNSLAALSSNPRSYQAYKHTNNYGDDMNSMFQQMREAMNNMHSQMFGNPNDTTNNGMLGNVWDDMFAPDGFLFDKLENLKNGGSMQKFENFFQSFGDGENISSSSVQITEENGKTKIKIDSKNSDMTYIIDGVLAPKNNIQMPESILNVNIIPSKEDIKKSYLFITSKNKLGEFNSYQNGILTFKYKNQEYKYNLDKVQQPLLVIDGRLSSGFDIDPSAILQIRPISQIEKEVGYYPNAEVIINTK